MADKPGIKVVANNKKAFHEYYIEERYEAGIELFGTEVKSIRAGKVSLKEAWCSVDHGELFLKQMHISPYEQGSFSNRDPLRPKRLLMHKKEIMQLMGKQQQQGYALVPLVVQSDIYDLSVGDATVRPDAAMGYEAARLAMEAPNYRDGSYGAGCGATVGKMAGMDYCMKSGIGSYAIQIGELKIGAVVVVNALGDVYDWRTGTQIAGMLNEDRTGLRSTSAYMRGSYAVIENKFTGNTTICVVFTNAHFDKAQLCKIAGMAHDGYARSINPVHTSADGDSIYAVSIGEIEADQDLVGTLAAEVVSEAITRAVTNADGAYGYPAAHDLQK